MTSPGIDTSGQCQGAPGSRQRLAGKADPRSSAAPLIARSPDGREVTDLYEDISALANLIMLQEIF